MNWIKNKNNRLFLQAFFFGILVPCGSAAVGTNWIEQWGIRWTFDRNISVNGSAGTYRYGQFVNGDYWIVGPVTITAINPPSHNINGRVTNGSMINPQTGNAYAKQGYDNTMPFNEYDNNLNMALNIDGSGPTRVIPTTPH